MKTIELAKLGTLKNGMNFTKSASIRGCKIIGVSDFQNNVFPVYSSLAEIDSSIVKATDLLQDGDIVFVRSNGNKSLVGRSMIVKGIVEPICYSGFCISLRPNQDLILPEYLFYALRAPYCRMQYSYSQQTNITNLSQSVLGSVKVPYVSVSQQRKIARIFTDIDNKISLNKRINAELEALAKTLYDYWFAQFDFPDENGKPYRTYGGAMEWNEQLKREIPKGWSAATLNSYILNEKGGDWGKEEKSSNYTEEVTCIRGADFPAINGTHDIKTPLRYIQKKNTFKFLSNGDIIIEISGGSPTQSTGRICYINDEILKRFSTNIITSNFCKAFSLRSIEWQYWFYVTWTKLYEAGVFFKYEGKTTGIKNLLFDIACSDYYIASPPDRILKKYNSCIEPMFRKIQRNITENLELTALRDWLLPMLMNGQATVE